MQLYKFPSTSALLGRALSEQPWTVFSTFRAFFRLFSVLPAVSSTKQKCKRQEAVDKINMMTDFCCILEVEGHLFKGLNIEISNHCSYYLAFLSTVKKKIII